jgi:hypothetical protein
MVPAVSSTGLSPHHVSFKNLRPLFNHAKVNGGFGQAAGFEQLVKDKIIALLEVSTAQSLLRSLIVPV